MLPFLFLYVSPIKIYKEITPNIKFYIRYNTGICIYIEAKQREIANTDVSIFIHITCSTMMVYFEVISDIQW